MANPQSPRYNQEEDDLLELTGCESWEQIEDWFGGMTVEQITNECNRCWPGDAATNGELAQRIYNEL